MKIQMIIASIFLSAAIAFGAERSFKSRFTLLSIDLPSNTSVSQMHVDCDKRGLELRNVLNLIGRNLKVPQDKLGLFTDLYLYNPIINGSGGTYVCSLFLKSDDPQTGFRLDRNDVHKGKDYLAQCAQCKADSDALNSNQNILLVQTDVSWALIGGKKCQTYGVEVGKK